MRLIATCGMFVALVLCSATAQSKPASLRLAECEGRSLDPNLWLCGGEFTFTDKIGKARWPNKGTADLVIERFDDEQVLIRRTDTGLSLGATAVYTGRRNGYRIEGQVVYTWPAKWTEPKTGTFSATIEDGADTTPMIGTHRGDPFPDLNGIWRVKANGALIALVQSGPDVSTVLIVNGQPRSFVYRGRFASSTAISGHFCESSYDRDHPYCLLEPSTTTVFDSDHIRNSLGNDIERIAGRDDPRYLQALSAVPAKNAKPYFREQPFDLTGTWQASIQSGVTGRMQIKQADGMVTIFDTVGGHPFFVGWYPRNAAIGGTRLSRASTSYNVQWTPQTLFIDSPDAMHVTSEGAEYELFRISPPALGDLPCDLANPTHMDPYYAWMRARVALQAKDDTAARCWSTLSSNLDWPAGQSLLAAVLLNDPRPDYQEVFQLAAKSAAKGDVMGQYELAGLYREGKGTAQDAAKAQYWQERAQRTQEAAKMRAFNAKMSVVNAMGQALATWFLMEVGDESEEHRAAAAKARADADFHARILAREAANANR